MIPGHDLSTPISQLMLTSLGRRPLFALRCLALLLLLVLAAEPLRAQVPPALPGRWALRQIAYEALRPLSDSLQEQLFHSPAADTNIGISNGELLLVVDFRPDGTYSYTTSRRSKAVHTERGRYEVRKGKLYSQATDTTAIPLFDGQEIVQLTRRKMLLQSPFLNPSLQLFEQLLYFRLPSKKR
jgi:hypothetical protein